MVLRLYGMVRGHQSESVMVWRSMRLKNRPQPCPLVLDTLVQAQPQCLFPLPTPRVICIHPLSIDHKSTFICYANPCDSINTSKDLWTRWDISVSPPLVLSILPYPSQGRGQSLSQFFYPSSELILAGNASRGRVNDLKTGIIRIKKSPRECCS